MIRCGAGAALASRGDGLRPLFALAVALGACALAGCGMPRFGVECRVDAETCARAIAAADTVAARQGAWSAVVVPPVAVQISIGRYSLGSDVAGIIYRDLGGEVTAVVMVGAGGPQGDHAWQASGRFAAAYEAASR